MKVIAISNNKGGVGKTITAVSLAAALHHLHGQRVLLVDADPQGNATKHLLGRNVELDQHLGNAIINQSFDDVILETSSGVDVAPSNLRLGSNDAIIQDQKQWRYRLSRTLATVKDHYDYVVIDCPPLLGTFTVMALVAADAYLIPTEPEEFALSGLSQLTELADGVAEALNPRLTLLGVCVTRYNKNLRNSTHDTVMEALRQQYGVDNMLPTVRKDKTVSDAIARATSIFHVNPSSNVAQDYAALTDAVLARLQ